MIYTEQRKIKWNDLDWIAWHPKIAADMVKRAALK